MIKHWIAVFLTAIGVLALASCRGGAAAACEDFIDAVEECQGAPDDHYNQAWCDEGVEGGCEDRRYYRCLEDNLECENGDASTTPILCQVEADIGCPD